MLIQNCCPLLLSEAKLFAVGTHGYFSKDLVT